MKKFVMGVCICFLSCAGFAQTDIYGGDGIGELRGLGYKNPTLDGVGGLEFEKSHFLIWNENRIEWARKIIPGDGFDFGTKVEGYTKIKSGVLLGAAATWTKDWTSQFSKSAWHPDAMAGYQFRTARMEGGYIFSKGDPQNAVHGADVAVEIWQSRISLRTDLQILRYHPTLQPTAPESWGIVYGGTLRFHSRAR